MKNPKLICFKCKHFDDAAPGCAAFPVAIPKVILSGKDLHKKPLKDQDNDLIFKKG